MKHALLSAAICLFVCNPLVLAQNTRRRQPLSTKPAVSQTQTEAHSAENLLPIRRVILYSNGVAYIERRGLVNNHAEVSLSFKQSQVDDVLKSMVVLDLGKGRVGAVSYNSSAPPSSRLSEIPFAISAATDGNNGGGLAGVLSQLQGARVVVSTGNRMVAGSILTVEAKHSQIDASKPPVTTHKLVIASDNGEVSGFDLAEVRSIQLADEGSRRDLTEFAHAAASARRRDAKTIVVTSDGVGQREMVVSYTIAAPIWKTTYRVVLDEKGKPFFQGWAIVDNISEEDWNGIQLSLVSGTPVSFIQQIQNPVYRYRPIVPLQQDLNMKPQTYEPGEIGATGTGSLNGVVNDPNNARVAGARVLVTNTTSNQSFEITTNSDGGYSVSDLPPGLYTLKVIAPGFKETQVTSLNLKPGLRTNMDVNLEVGSVQNAVTIDGTAATSDTLTMRSLQGLPLNSRGQQLFALTPGISGGVVRTRAPISQIMTGGQSGVEAQTSASEVGDLFEYRIEQPVTVQRDRSALIPILQTRMEGERVSIFNEQSPSNRPMSGMLLKNTSSLTLDDGSLTVIDGDAYAGEALMQRLKPSEERLISFALDLGTLVNTEEEEDQRPTYMVKIHNGVAATYYFNIRKKTYTIVNQTDQPRTVYLEHPISQSDYWTLSDETPKPADKTATHYRFRVSVAAHQKIEFPVVERKEQYDSFSLSDFNRGQLDLFISRRYIDEQTRQVLERIIDLKAQLIRAEEQLQENNRDATAIAQDQQRLRENIKTLTSTAEAKQLIARYVSKANEQENSLERLEAERKKIIEERTRLQNELAAAIRGVSLDRKID
jgi:carboxypeptidase family protein